jgi:hypothetical protein
LPSTGPFYLTVVSVCRGNFISSHTISHYY